MEWVKSGEREKIPAQTPTNMAALISRCWAQRAEERPNASEAVKSLLSSTVSAIPAYQPPSQFSYRGNLSSGKY